MLRGSEIRSEIWQAIGVAGTVAETLWFERGDLADQEFFWDFHFDAPAAMSQSDWELCRAEPEIDADELAQAAAQVAGLLLGDLRKKLIHTTRRLIVEARNPNTSIN